MPAEASPSRSDARRPPPPTQINVRYHKFWMTLSYAALLYVTYSYVNDRWLRGTAVYSSSAWLSANAEIFAMLVLGLWRVVVAPDEVDRRRAWIIVVSTAFVYSLIGSVFVFQIPCLGDVPCTWPATHTPGSATFLALAVLTALFGRRVDCGYCCTCVGLRETAAYAFRHRTVRGGFWWNWARHGKWVLFAFMLVVIVLSIPFPFWPVGIHGRVLPYFWDVVLIPYYASLLLIPFMGNRNYCRLLCPFGALYGLMNRFGAYKIVANRDRCVGCRLCESVCDMGVPIEELVRLHGAVDTTDCMGCARCVTACPRGVLSIRDSKHLIWRACARLMPRGKHSAESPPPAVQ